MEPARHGALNKVAEVCADDAEVLALSILRMVMAGYATGDVDCWDMAYTGAERHLRPETAARLVAGLTGLSRAIRAERKSNWHFMPATCCRVTKDEEAALRLLSAARGDVERDIADAAMDVIGVRASSSLERSARVAARLIAETAEAMKATRRGARVH